MKKNGGFTIIETIVAIGVLTIGIIGIASFFTKSTTITRSASNISVATNLATGALDEELAKSYNDLTVGTGARSTYNATFDKFEKQVNISYIDQNLSNAVDDNGLKKIDVLIYWQESGIEKNVHLSTIKTRR